MVSMITTAPRHTVPFVTSFDILQIHQNYWSAIRSQSSPIIARARIPHYHPKCPRDSKRPTTRNGAELVPSREIDRFLTECHVIPPSCLGEDKLHLIRICSFPVHGGMCELFDPIRKPGVTCQLSCSYRRPAVSPAMINAGTTAITTPNAFIDGGKFL
jgi:hypothetical protein